jgi:predicted metalloendopeptidase
LVTNAPLPHVPLPSCFATQLDDSQDFSVWETYLRWAVLNQLAPSLSQDFVDANFNFFGKIYSGTSALLLALLAATEMADQRVGILIAGKKQNTPLWKRCVQQTDLSLGELLGRYYVLQDFPALSKQMASDLVQRIEDAFLANLASTPLSHLFDFDRSMSTTYAALRFVDRR